MPIYEYECSKCGKITEAMQRFSDPPLTECSHCGGPVRKMISMSTFHLKGSGWYVTDYSGKNQSVCSAGGEQQKGSEKNTEASSSESKESK
jgi:putative FmdB family regulatory protein